jgi:hypothetical protein
MMKTKFKALKCVFFQAGKWVGAHKFVMGAEMRVTVVI